MWVWLLPFERNSLRSAKDKGTIIRELIAAVHLYRHWLFALIEGPTGEIVGDFREGRFNLVQKRVSGPGGYFPLARIIVEEDGGGSILKIRYSSPPFHVFLSLVFLWALFFIFRHQWAVAFVIPTLWGIAHMFCCLSYQIEKERMEAKIRDIL